MYLEYSTVVDAPTTIAVTREEMRAYLIKRDGEGYDQGAWIDDRLDRAERQGSSCMLPGSTLESEVLCNHAGKDETTMSVEQFIRYFFVEHEQRRTEHPNRETLLIDEVKRGGDDAPT
jgi:hypothetical protein